MRLKMANVENTWKPQADTDRATLKNWKKTMIAAVKKERFVPLWIWALIVIDLVLVGGVTIVGMQDITVMHPDQAGSSYLSSLYITRNVIDVVGLGLALFVFRSYIALFLAFLARVMTEVSDFSNSYWFGRDPEMMTAIPYLIVLMVVIPTIALIVLWPKVKAEIALLSRR